MVDIERIEKLAPPKIQVSTVGDYKKSQKGTMTLNSGHTFEVEQIPFKKQTEIFNALQKQFPAIKQHQLLFQISRNEEVKQIYAQLAIPIFVKHPKITPTQTKNSIGVDRLHILDKQELINASLLGITPPGSLLRSFRGRESDIDEIIDELSSLRDEAE